MSTNLSKGLITQLLQTEDRLEINCMVPSIDTCFMYQSENVQHKEFNLQILNYIYCDCFNVVWIELYDGNVKYFALLAEKYWSNTISFKNYKLEFLTEFPQKKKAAFWFKKAKIKLIKYTFESLLVCQNPVCNTTHLKIVDFIFFEKINENGEFFKIK
jgi:hypothetical protein